MRNALEGQLGFAAAVVVSVLLWTSDARAESGVREVDYPSTFSNPVAIVWLCVCFIVLVGVVGGVIATLKQRTTKSEVSASYQGHSWFQIKNVGQGVVVILLTALLMGASFYFIPKTAHERTVEHRKTIEEFSPDGKLQKRTVGHPAPTSKDE